MHDHSNSWTNKYRRQPLRQLYCTLRSRHTVVEAKIENVSNVCTCRQQVSRMVFTGQSRGWKDIDRRRGKVGRGPLKRGCALHRKNWNFSLQIVQVIFKSHEVNDNNGITLKIN